MYSVNASVPGAVERLAADLRPELLGFERIRDQHTLLLKRLNDDAEYHRTAAKARDALRGAPAVEARVTGIDTFTDPPSGSAPVLYLAIESPGLYDLHRRLCEVFEPIPILEGDDYTPHVTLARGGNESVAERLVDYDIDEIRWTISELQLWDPAHAEVAGRIPLPA